MLITLARGKEILADLKYNKPTQQFEVEFVKRSDGQYRKMKCQGQDVTYVPGGPAKYKPEDKELMNVYDLEKNRYGSINLPQLCKIIVDGVENVIIENEKLIPV